MHKKLILFAFLAFTTACGTTSKKTDEEKALLHHDLGNKLLAARKYPAALKQLSIAYKLNPNDKFICNTLGIAYYVRSKYKDAVIYFNQALQQDPMFTVARINLGRVYLDLGKYDLAKIEFKKATDDLTYPEPDISWMHLGLAHFKSRGYTTALKHFAKSLELNRNNCETLTYYGRSLFELQRFDQAAYSFDATIDRCKEANIEESQYYGALAYYKLGKKNQAITRFEELITRTPHSKLSNQAQKMIKMIR